MENYGVNKAGYEAVAGLGSEMEDLKGDSQKTTTPKYVALLQEVANLQRTEITVDLDDLIDVHTLPGAYS